MYLHPADLVQGYCPINLGLPWLALREECEQFQCWTLLHPNPIPSKLWRKYWVDKKLCLFVQKYDAIKIQNSTNWTIEQFQCWTLLQPALTQYHQNFGENIDLIKNCTKQQKSKIAWIGQVNNSNAGHCCNQPWPNTIETLENILSW